MTFIKSSEIQILYIVKLTAHLDKHRQLSVEFNNYRLQRAEICAWLVQQTLKHQRRHELKRSGRIKSDLKNHWWCPYLTGSATLLTCNVSNVRCN